MQARSEYLSGATAYIRKNIKNPKNARKQSQAYAKSAMKMYKEGVEQVEESADHSPNTAGWHAQKSRKYRNLAADAHDDGSPEDADHYTKKAVEHYAKAIELGHNMENDPPEIQKWYRKHKKVDESHHVQLEVEDHHEVRMAQSDLYKTVKCATELHKMLDKVSDLEGWVQAKITLASDYIETVKDHLEYELARRSHEMHSGYETPPSLEVFENKKKK